MDYTPTQNHALRWFKELYEKIKQKAEDDGGMLTEDDQWKYNYLSYPYLLLESDEYIVQRFNDVLNNLIEIGENGKIQMVSTEHYKKLAELQTGMQWEMNVRQTWSGVEEFTMEFKNIIRMDFQLVRECTIICERCLATF